MHVRGNDSRVSGWWVQGEALPVGWRPARAEAGWKVQGQRGACEPANTGAEKGRHAGRSDVSGEVEPISTVPLFPE